jgi:transcriptional regulator with XRE-family HTH domain
MPTIIGDRIEHALIRARISQRTLATETGISQATLSRIIAGARAPKMPEVLAIALALGTTVTELTGTGSIAERAQSAARATNGAGMAEMRRELLLYLELDAYLDDQAIPASA